MSGRAQAGEVTGGSGVLDAYTDDRKMPPDVEAAEDALWALGKRQQDRDPG